MSTEDNKLLARRLLDELWNRGNLGVADELLAPECRGHPTGNWLLAGGEDRELRGVKGNVASYRNAFPDLHLTIDDQIAEGDKVVSRFVATGTQSGSLGSIPPSGKRVTMTGIWIHRFANGKVVEMWSNFDALGLLAQLGAVRLEQD